MRYFCESLSAHLINYLLIIINNKLTADSVHHASFCCVHDSPLMRDPSDAHVHDSPLMRDPSDAHHEKSDGSGAI